MKFYSDLIGYTLLWVKQNLQNELKSILGFLDLSRTFGPAKLVPGSDLKPTCPTGPTGLTVSEPLDYLMMDVKKFVRSWRNHVFSVNASWAAQD